MSNTILKTTNSFKTYESCKSTLSVQLHFAKMTFKRFENCCFFLSREQGFAVNYTDEQLLEMAVAVRPQLETGTAGVDFTISPHHHHHLPLQEILTEGRCLVCTKCLSGPNINISTSEVKLAP